MIATGGPGITLRGIDSVFDSSGLSERVARMSWQHYSVAQVIYWKL